MPDSFLGLLRFSFMAGRPARHKATQLFGLAADDGELDIGKADQPIAGFGFGDADRLAGQRLAEEEQIAAPFDLTVGARPARSGWDKVAARGGNGWSAAPGRALRAGDGR